MSEEEYEWTEYPEVPFKVVCIENSQSCEQLTQGEEYVVVGIEKICFTIKLNDRGDEGVEYFQSRFKPSSDSITERLENTATNVLSEAENVSESNKGIVVGVKHDQGKLEWTLLPWKALKPVVEVLMYGNKKYPDPPENANWKKVEPKRYKDAALRHLTDWLSGDKVDSETGKSHLAHCACCILFLLWFEVTGKLDE